MDSDKARRLFLRYSPSVAYIVVEDARSTRTIGSAFHVGEGVFVTARHVVERKEIKEIGLSFGLISIADGLGGGPYDAEMEQLLKMHCGSKILSLASGPFFHPDPNVDVAAVVCEGLHPNTPPVPMGTHLDDWIGVRDFVLSEAIIMGYPPIPLTRENHLVCAKAEVNAVIDLAIMPHVHFVLSAMPRGGFSGGVAISEYGFLLGVITQSLVRNDESGFFTVVSVEDNIFLFGRAQHLPKDQEFEA
jgi:Trypsin-like peptidase domain